MGRFYTSPNPQGDQNMQTNNHNYFSGLLWFAPISRYITLARSRGSFQTPGKSVSCTIPRLSVDVLPWENTLALPIPARYNTGGNSHRFKSFPIGLGQGCHGLPPTVGEIIAFHRSVTARLMFGSPKPVRYGSATVCRFRRVREAQEYFHRDKQMCLGINTD